MSIKLLTILSGLTGFTVGAFPVSTLAVSTKEIKLIQSESNYKVQKINDVNKVEYNISLNNFQSKINEFNKKINQDIYGLNSFPVSYNEELIPGFVATIPLDKMWEQAKDLKKQAENNNWSSWGYSAASFFAIGTGSNGMVTVEVQIILSPTGLAPMIADLNLVAHGSPIKGKLTTKVVSNGSALIVEAHYSSSTAGDVIVMKSNPITSLALGTIILLIWKYGNYWFPFLT